MDGMRRMLYPSTIEFIKRRFNAVIRVVICAAILAIGWIALMGIGIALNFALEYTLEAVGAPDFIRSLSSLMLWAALALLGLAITITSVSDAINLAMVGLKNPFDPKDGTQR